MKKTRIWFNRWFSTAYNIIDLVRGRPEGRPFEIFVSHPNSYSINLQNADVAFLEPNLSDSEYVDYALEQCKKYQIDLFLPCHKALLISKNLDKFEALGTKVLVSPNHKLLELIDNKVAFYEDILPKNLIKIPEYCLVKNKKELIEAYDRIKEKGRVCFKPVSGVGGLGFRIIKEAKPSISEILSSQPSFSINLDELLSILPERDTFENIMMMEYLDGYEYSIDCLADKNGRLLAAIPRKKMDAYNQYLENNQALIHFANEISRSYQIPYAYNIQVKFKNEEAYLLEINGRMSGGIHHSCLAGINIPLESIYILMDSPEAKNNFDLHLDILVGKVSSFRVNARIL